MKVPMVECAKCDCLVDPKKLVCKCGNKIAGKCNEHRIIYDLNILPACPMCHKTDLSKKSLSRLTQLRKGGGKWTIITASSMIQMKVPRESKKKAVEDQQESTFEQFHAPAATRKPLSLSDAKSMVGT